MADIGSDFLFPPTSSTSTATTSGVSTAAVDITGAVDSAGFYDFSIKGADVHILFGKSTVAAATTSNGFYLSAGSRVSYWIDPTVARYFTAIATSAVAGQAINVARSGP
jgi:hypothetical protein